MIDTCTKIPKDNHTDIYILKNECNDDQSKSQWPNLLIII